MKNTIETLLNDLRENGFPGDREEADKILDFIADASKEKKEVTSTLEVLGNTPEFLKNSNLAKSFIGILINNNENLFSNHNFLKELINSPRISGDIFSVVLEKKLEKLKNITDQEKLLQHLIAYGYSPAKATDDISSKSIEDKHFSLMNKLSELDPDINMIAGKSVQDTVNLCLDLNGEDFNKAFRTIVFCNDIEFVKKFSVEILEKKARDSHFNSNRCIKTIYDRLEANIRYPHYKDHNVDYDVIDVIYKSGINPELVSHKFISPILENEDLRHLTNQKHLIGLVSAEHGKHKTDIVTSYIQAKILPRLKMRENVSNAEIIIKKAQSFEKHLADKYLPFNRADYDRISQAFQVTIDKVYSVTVKNDVAQDTSKPFNTIANYMSPEYIADYLIKIESNALNNHTLPDAIKEKSVNYFMQNLSMKQMGELLKVVEFFDKQSIMYANQNWLSRAISQMVEVLGNLFNNTITFGDKIAQQGIEELLTQSTGLNKEELKTAAKISVSSQGESRQTRDKVEKLVDIISKSSSGRML